MIRQVWIKPCHNQCIILSHESPLFIKSCQKQMAVKIRSVKSLGKHLYGGFSFCLTSVKELPNCLLCKVSWYKEWQTSKAWCDKITWRCCCGFGGLPSWTGADKPTIWATLCDRNKQCPVAWAGEIPLASILPIRAAVHIIVLIQSSQNPLWGVVFAWSQHKM